MSYHNYRKATKTATYLMVGALLHITYLLQFWEYLFRLETKFLGSHAADEDSGIL